MLIIERMSSLSNNDKFYRGQTNLQEIRASISPALESYNKTIETFQYSMKPVVASFGALHSNLLKDIIPTVTAVTAHLESFSVSLPNIVKQQQEILERLGPLFKLANEHQDLTYKAFKKMYEGLSGSSHLSTITASLESALVEENIRNIDFSGLEHLNLVDRSISDDLNDGMTETANAGADCTVPKKTLADMTEEDFKKIVAGATTAKTFSVAAFIMSLYSDYVNDAVKVIIEVVFAFMLTMMTGHYNAEVKNAIIDTVQETQVVTDLRKVITKYVKVNPTDQVAFLRKESFLRSGASKTAPIEIKEKITTKTVLTIVERKNNWLKVEIDSGVFSGEIGWIEESKVVKFKKIN
ncbi:hypothetical protein AB7M70_011854 [Bradyrhizobium japonicum]